MDDYGKKEGNWKMIHKRQRGWKFCNGSKRWKKLERELKKKKKKKKKERKKREPWDEIWNNVRMRIKQVLKENNMEKGL